MPPLLILRLVVTLLTAFERDDVFYPLQVLLVPVLVFAACIVWGRA